MSKSDKTTSSTISSPATDTASAVSMGWRFAELYHFAPYTMPEEPKPTDPPPPHLPGVGQMSSGERAIATLLQIDAGITAAGLDPAKLTKSTATIKHNIQGPHHTTAAIQDDVLELYQDIRNTLAGQDPMLATAFGLGRMLADTCLLSTAGDRSTYETEFAPYRLQNAYDWLDELSHRLPADSAGTVKSSLKMWADWLSGPPATARPFGRGTGQQVAVTAATTSALHRQGDLWRRLLAGEQKADDLLDAASYEQASLRVLSNARRITVSFIGRWWPFVILAVAALAAVVVGVVWVSSSGNGNAVSLSLAGLAALGLTWKGVGATLGKALSLVWKPMMAEEVEQARVIAATRLPGSRADHGLTDLPTDDQSPADPPMMRATRSHHRIDLDSAAAAAASNGQQTENATVEPG